MEIHEITRLKAQKLDEISLGAIPGAVAGKVKQAAGAVKQVATGPTAQALGGIASQYIQQKMNPYGEPSGPTAAVGQERNVAYALTDPLVKQQAAQAYQSWQQGVQAKLQEFGQSDASKLGQREIATMLQTYVDQRLMPSSQTVGNLQGHPAIANSIKKSMDTITLNTLANKWKDPKTADAWMQLVKTIRISQFQTPTGPAQSRGTGQTQTAQATQLTPQAQAHLQAMAPGIQALQGYWPRGQTTKVPATSNQAVNALLSGMGLLI